MIATLTQRRNQTPCDDFQGLSPEQVHRFISFPFDSPNFVTFADAPEDSLTAPIIRLFAMLVEAIGERGLKPTATGNLPRNLMRASALAYWGEERYREETRYGEPRTEPEFFDLHITRLVAEMAGLIRKYKGKFILSRDCRTLHTKQGSAGVCLPLLRAFATRFNWAYRGWHDDLPIIQQAFLYTVYLLQRFGEAWRETTFYEDAFLRAFPQALDELAPRSYGTPESIVRQTYTQRALEHFAVFLGLAEMRPVGDPKERRGEIRALPLVHTAIRFTL